MYNVNINECTGAKRNKCSEIVDIWCIHAWNIYNSNNPINNIVHLLKGGRNIFKINNICHHQNLNGSRMDRSKIKTLYFKL